jgi:DNA adenine methylase
MTATAQHIPTSRPALQWHGGKWLLAPWIIQHFPEHRRYVEPYAGGASVLLRKPRSHSEVYNDLDAEVVNFFQVMRDQGVELVRRLAITPYARDEFSRAYTPTDEPIERARRLVIRSFMGFGSNAHQRISGFRASSERSVTSPAREWANYPEAARAIVARLQGVVIENRPALDLIQATDSADTLFYLDPPYVSETRDPGADYAHEMRDDDHRAMLRVARSLTGSVAISGYRCNMYDDELRGWTRIDRNAFADGARPRVESLWINYELRQQSLL